MEKVYCDMPPKLFEEVEKNIYIIRWGVSGRMCYESLFKIERNITAAALERLIVNNDFTMTELKEIVILAGLSEADSVLFLKKMISRLIIEYDSSSAVNEFLVADLPVWLDKETRVGLALRFASEKGIGLTNTTLWLNGMQFPFQIVVAEQILGAIEVYASMCYDNTQKHLFQVQNLQSIDELVRFDITEGFPEKLSFNM
jgi:hypothetical protein